MCSPVQTAYFVIPENVRHGEELICSYFACRNAGVKFRYCSHCKVPVAKRNFRKRHRHGISVPKGVADDDDDESNEDDSAGANADAEMDDIPSQVTTTKNAAPVSRLSMNGAADAAPESDFQDALRASAQQQANAQMAQLAQQEAASKQFQEHQAVLASLQAQQQIPGALGNLLNSGGGGAAAAAGGSCSGRLKCRWSKGKG